MVLFRQTMQMSASQSTGRTAHCAAVLAIGSTDCTLRYVFPRTELGKFNAKQLLGFNGELIKIFATDFL